MKLAIFIRVLLYVYRILYLKLVVSVKHMRDSHCTYNLYT